MTHTANSDVYGALHEDAVNTVIDHLMKKRPSLFHYGTERVIRAADQRREFVALASRRQNVLCVNIDHAKEVITWQNPLMSEVDPLPVLGTNGAVALDYCFQVRHLSINFSPDDPPTDIGDQQFAARVEVCAGLACPNEKEFERVRNRITDLRQKNGDRLAEEKFQQEFGLPIVPGSNGLQCFCLGITVVGSVSGDGPGVSGKWLEIPDTPAFRVDDIVFDTETQELSLPNGLSRSITCYVRSFIEFSLLPFLSESIANFVPSLPPDSFLALDLSGTRATASLPTGSGIANNPALEDDQLKVYANLALSGPGGP